MSMYNIYSPICGSSYPIVEVQDKVFSEKMLGDGIAIKVDGNVNSLVCPISGVVETIMDTKHAIVIKNGELEVLIHIGLDTCNLNGIGFNSKVYEKQIVNYGDELIDVDFELLSKNNLITDVIIVILSKKAKFDFTHYSFCNTKQLLLSVVI